MQLLRVRVKRNKAAREDRIVIHKSLGRGLSEKSRQGRLRLLMSDTAWMTGFQRAGLEETHFQTTWHRSTDQPQYLGLKLFLTVLYFKILNPNYH